MKNILFITLIFLGVVYATVNFEEKISSIYGLIDNVKDGLAEVTKNASRDANYSFRFLGDTTKTYIMSTYTRYLLAPNYVSNNASEYDTMLTICDARLYATAKHEIEDDRNVLMKQRYNQYYFIETSRK